MLEIGSIRFEDIVADIVIFTFGWSRRRVFLHSPAEMVESSEEHSVGDTFDDRPTSVTAALSFQSDGSARYFAIRPALGGRDLRKQYKRPIRKTIENGGTMQRVNYQISLWSPHENRKIERRVRKRYQISGAVGNLKITNDGTNKMRDYMSKMLAEANVILYLSGGRSSPYYRSDEIE